MKNDLEIEVNEKKKIKSHNGIIAKLQIIQDEF